MAGKRHLDDVKSVTIHPQSDIAIEMGERDNNWPTACAQYTHDNDYDNDVDCEPAIDELPAGVEIKTVPRKSERLRYPNPRYEDYET